MRITNNYINNVYNRYLNNNMAKIGEIQEKIASGKNINRPSDNPVQSSRLLEIQARMSYNEQFQENINEGRTLLNFTQTTLSDSTDIMRVAYDLSLMGADSAMDSEERRTLAFQVDQLLQEMIDVSRKKYQDKFIFGGTRTLEEPYKAYTDMNREQVAFDGINRTVQLTHNDIRRRGTIEIVDRDGNALQLGKDYDVNYDNGEIEFLEDGDAAFGAYFVTYQTYDVNFDVEPIIGVDENDKGVNTHFYQEIDQGIQVAMNINGYQSFQENIDVFETLVKLRNNLEDNNQEAVNGSVDEVQKSIRQLMDANALAGTKIQRLDLTLSRLVNNKVTLNELKSSINDIDMAEAAMELQQQRNVYQSSIYAGRAIFEATLVNFL